MRIFTQDEIESANQRGRTEVSRRENAEHRRIEDLARAERLKRDRLIVLALGVLRETFVAYEPQPATVTVIADIDAALKPYAYLDAIPPEAFIAR